MNTKHLISCIAMDALDIEELMSELYDRSIRLSEQRRVDGVLRFVRDLLLISKTHLRLERPAPALLRHVRAKVAKVLLKKVPC